MKRLSMMILLLSMVLMVSALDKRQTQINTIKKSKEYLYSDITMSTIESAASQAFDELQMEIFTWATDRADKKPGSAVSPQDINKLIDTIMVRRADMYRIFAYVKKVKLVPLFSDWNLVLLDSLDSDEGKLRGLPDGSDLAENSKPKEESKDSLAKDSVVNKKVLAKLRNNYLGRKGGVIELIKKAKNFFELKQIMEPLKQKGEIVDYGKYATAKKPEDCYLIVYDPAGNIKALLGKGEEVRQNLKTGKEDSIMNYRGCGAIWFTLKN